MATKPVKSAKATSLKAALGLPVTTMPVGQPSAPMFLGPPVQGPSITDPIDATEPNIYHALNGGAVDGKIKAPKVKPAQIQNDRGPSDAAVAARKAGEAERTAAEANAIHLGGVQNASWQKAVDAKYGLLRKFTDPINTSITYDKANNTISKGKAVPSVAEIQNYINTSGMLDPYSWTDDSGVTKSNHMAFDAQTIHDELEKGIAEQVDAAQKEQAAHLEFLRKSGGFHLGGFIADLAGAVVGAGFGAGFGTFGWPALAQDAIAAAGSPNPLKSFGSSIAGGVIGDAIGPSINDALGLGGGETWADGTPFGSGEISPNLETWADGTPFGSGTVSPNLGETWADGTPFGSGEVSPNYTPMTGMSSGNQPGEVAPTSGGGSPQQYVDANGQLHVVIHPQPTSTGSGIFTNPEALALGGAALGGGALLAGLGGGGSGATATAAGAGAGGSTGGVGGSTGGTGGTGGSTGGTGGSTGGTGSGTGSGTGTGTGSGTGTGTGSGTATTGNATLDDILKGLGLGGSLGTGIGGTGITLGQLLGLGGTIWGGINSSNTANSIADAELAANTNALNFQKQVYHDTTTNLKPYLDNGTAANKALADALGTSGNTTAAGYGNLTKAFSPTDLTNEPGYKFTLDQGNKALNNSLGAKGSVFSGEALKAGARYAEGLAGTTYQDAFNRDQSTKNQLYNFLSGSSASGQNAAVQQGTAGSNFATNAGNLAVSAGNINAGNATAQNNIFNQSLANGLNGITGGGTSSFNIGGSTGGYVYAGTDAQGNPIYRRS